MPWVVLLVEHQPRLHQPWRLDGCDSFVHAFVQVLNSGKFALEDALNVIWSLNGVQSVPVTNSGVMSVGQTLVTVRAQLGPER